MPDTKTTEWEYWEDIKRWVRHYGPGLSANVWPDGSYAVFVKGERDPIISEYTPLQGDLKLARHLCDRALTEYLKEKIRGLQAVLDLMPYESLTYDQTRMVISALLAKVRPRK